MNHLKNGCLVDKAIVLTLPRRANRLALFQKRLPVNCRDLLSHVDVIHGCDAKRLGKAPEFTRQTAGAWGCRQSHLRILESAATEGWERVLVFEDDANVSMLSTNLTTLIEFLSKVPDDWDFVQFGYYSRHNRIAIDPLDDTDSAVCQVERAVNAHAIVYNGRSAGKIYDAIWSWDAALTANSKPIDHIDQSLNRLSNLGAITRYVTRTSLVWQDKRFESDIVKLRSLKGNRDDVNRQ